VNRGIPLIPVRLDDAAPSKSLEYFISTPHWLDALTPPLESHLQRVAQAVKALLQRLAGNNGPETSAGTTGPEPPPREQANVPLQFCIHCGARRVAGNRFCTGCGKPTA
jgi:hypothetical protein